jgi:hypothetical protein
MSSRVPTTVHFTAMAAPTGVKKMATGNQLAQQSRQE